MFEKLLVLGSIMGVIDLVLLVFSSLSLSIKLNLALIIISIVLLMVLIKETKEWVEMC